MISLAGKAALITGGSRGIGAAAVRLFAQAGADVIFNYNKAKDAAHELEKEAGRHGTRVEAFKADVGKHADNKKLVEQTIARLGRLDILVANAGVWNLEDLPIEKMSEAQWDEMIRVNLEKRLLHHPLCRPAHDQAEVRPQSFPSVPPPASVANPSTLTTGPPKAPSSASPKAWPPNLLPHGILVNSVAPGWVATDMSNPVLETKSGQKMAAAAIPLGRPVICRRNRRTHPLSRFRPGQLPHRRNHQC